MSDKIAEIEKLKRHLALVSERVRQLSEERDYAWAEVEKQRVEIERLTRERDESRYFLKIFVHAHASNNAVPPHLEEQARNALEGKP